MYVHTHAPPSQPFKGWCYVMFPPVYPPLTILTYLDYLSRHQMVFSEWTDEPDKARVESRQRGREGVNALLGLPCLQALSPPPTAASPSQPTPHLDPCRWSHTCLFWKIAGGLPSPGPPRRLSSNGIASKRSPNGCFVAEKYYQLSLGKDSSRGYHRK